MKNIYILLLQNDKDWIYLIEKTLNNHYGIEVASVVSDAEQAISVSSKSNKIDLAIFDENLVYDIIDDVNIIQIISNVKKIPIVLLVNDIKNYINNLNEPIRYLQKDKLEQLPKYVIELFSQKELFMYEIVNEFDDNEIHNKIKGINGRKINRSFFSKIKDLF